MKTKIVFQTDQMGLFIGETEAEESPLEPGVFLIPGGCVETPPPTAPVNKAACWSKDKWVLVDYFQGVIVYSTATTESLTLTGAGPIPNGYTLKAPQPGQVWKNGRWIDDLNAQMAKLYPQKLEAINEGCASFIVCGFSSDALGEFYRYESELEDQINLTGMVLSGQAGLYACTDAARNKEFREHSAEQLHRVGLHLVTLKQRALQQAAILKKALAQALTDKDLAAMNALQWSPPA